MANSTTPTVIDTVDPSSGDLGQGNGIAFTLTTSEPVVVRTGPDGATPDLILNDGGTALYDGQTGSSNPTSALNFVTVVATGENATPIAVTGVDLNGSTVEDQNGNPADLSGAVAMFNGLDVDTTPPTVSSPTDTLAYSSGPTPIGIAAPTDNVTPTGSLVINVDNVPSFGIATLADGAPLYTGESLTVQQLTSLLYTPGGNQGGQDEFSYTVRDQAGNDAQGTARLFVTPPPPPGTVAFGPNAAFIGGGTFVLSGTASSEAGVNSVEISAEVDGTETDLGAATVNADGTWTFADHVGPHTQGFITATETDNAGGAGATVADYSLQAGIGGERYQAIQASYNANGVLNSIAYNRTDGSRTVVTESIYQELTSQYDDTFLNGGAGLVNFVFDPGYGNDTLAGFRLFGRSHDGVQLSASDFADFAQVIRDTQNTPNGAVIHDTTTGDTILFAGVTKKELSHAGADFAFITS